MNAPLTPLEFARRARRLYAHREAVVDGPCRLSFAQFFERCDRWSGALQRLGVRQGDRVAYIAPNSCAQLESFYAVPQIGAVLVPINYRLTGDDFAYILQHSGARIVGELRVVDEAGHEVPHDGMTMGEIVVRGNAVMKGYYNDPEATSRAFDGGWFHTGDAAVVHPDGYAEIRDRLKDVIISGGENISSVEVEGVLVRHPAVQEVAIIGLPDARWGEAPHAFVVLRPGASVAEPELRQFARDRLAHFKVPHTVRFVPELPKTATGKIQKYILRGGASAIATQ